MILSCRDKRTRDFVAGKPVKAFTGFDRAARMKIDRLEAATSIKDLSALPGNRFEALRATVRVSSAFASTINGGYVSSGLRVPRAHPTLKSPTITEGEEAMEAIHPGEHLAEELAELSLSAAAFARHLAVPTNRITQILNGRRSISGDTALRLAHFFGTSPAFWLNLQSLYEIRLAQKKSGEAIRSLPTIRNLPTIAA